MYRFYDPEDGRILIAGKDIKDMTLESLRKSIGIVPQVIYVEFCTAHYKILFYHKSLCIFFYQNKNNLNTKIRYFLLCHPKQEKTQGHLVPTLNGTNDSNTLGEKVESKVALYQTIQIP